MGERCMWKPNVEKLEACTKCAVITSERKKRVCNKTIDSVCIMNGHGKQCIKKKLTVKSNRGCASA